MKKILTTLSTLLIATVIYAQAGLDTVFVRTVQWKYEEWCWGIEALGDPKTLDSFSKKQYKKLIRFLDDANPGGFSTNITYDSLPGTFAMKLFTDYWAHHEARENMGQGIDNKLRAYAPLTPYIDSADAERLSKFTIRKKSGQDIIE